MRVTIAPSQPQDDEHVKTPSVTVELPQDDMTIAQMFDMFEYALCGAGWGRELIEAYYRDGKQ